MSKGRARRLKKSTKPQHQAKRKGMIILGVLLCLTTAFGIMAQWKVLPGTGQPLFMAQSGTGNYNANSPSKEYVYAGGRLIATEEPAGTTTPPESPTPTVTPTPSITPTPTPPPGGYHSLDLSSGTKHVEVNSSTSLNITGPLTIEAWIRPDYSTSDYQYIVSRDDWYQSEGSYKLYLVEGKLRFDVMYGTGMSYMSITGTTPVTAGEWHHVAGVFDGNQMLVYLDGKRDGSLSSNLAPASTTNKLRIGRGTNPSALWPFKGLIDEVRVSKAALYTAETFTPDFQLTATGVITAGLWRFDEQDLADTSDYSNTSNPQGGTPVYSTDVPKAVAKKSLLLDETNVTTPNAYVEVLNNNLNLRDSLTVEARVKFTADTTYPYYRNIVMSGDTWNLGFFYYTLRIADGKVRFDLGQGNGGYVGLIGSTTLTTGVWHHVAGVYDSENDKMMVYVDGVKDGEQQGFIWNPPTAAAPFRIGRETNVSFPFNFKGWIDDVRVSSVARYTAQSVTVEPSLTALPDTKGLWKFDGGEAKDKAGTNDGTLQGTATYSDDVPDGGISRLWLFEPLLKVMGVANG